MPENNCKQGTIITPIQYVVGDNGIFPGNKLPVLLYKKALKIPAFFPSKHVKDCFALHDWTNNWRDGIYTMDHYHSNTHEAMAVIRGRTVLLLGGENGTQIVISKGDLIVIPAGVSHRNRGNLKDVICIGGYPQGKDFDMNYGTPDERPVTDEIIASLPLPRTGPLYGKNDPLLQIWLSVVMKDPTVTPV